MFKILLKAAVLFLIVLSIYLIVNPMACSNMLAGRERITPAEGTTDRPDGQRERVRTLQDREDVPDEMLAPSEQENLEGIFDTNTMKAGQTYSQEDMDYAVASQYVELEREYARHHTVGKDTAREISYTVMDNFGMSPAEWEHFLSRATASNLFERARRDLPPLDEEK